MTAATAGFGDVQYADPAAENSSSPAGANGASQEPAIDINDPRLTSETIDINPEADAYARPPQLPDGKWRAKLKSMDVKGPDGKPAHFSPKLDKQGKPYLFTALEASIIDHTGQFDGIRLNDYFVSTMVRRDQSTAVSTILNKLGSPAPRTATHSQYISLLLKALAGEPEIGIESAWEWSCQKCGEEADKKGEKRPRSVYGMHNFAQMQVKDSATGKLVMRPNPERKCDVNPAHGISIARPRINAYLSLDELKAAGK